MLVGQNRQPQRQVPIGDAAVSDELMTLATILREVMADKGIGIRRLESLSGIDRRTIQRILAGKTDPRVGVLERLCEALDGV